MSALNSTHRLQDNVFLVTGGASGIGRATVLRLLDEGALVVFADVNLDTGTATLKAAEDAFGPDRVRFFPCDVTVESHIEHAVQFALGTFGRLDGLVNCAGTGGALNGLLHTAADHWDKTQELLARSVFLSLKHAARAMIGDGRGGAVVNVASIAGIGGGAGGPAYSAAKACAINLGKSAALDLAKYRIRVNTVSPGPIVTPLLVRGGDPDGLRRAAVAAQPWPEAGEPEDVAACIAFLLSDDARFVTGANLVVDGGICAQAGNLYEGDSALGAEIVEGIRRSGEVGFDQGSTVPNTKDLGWQKRLDEIDFVPPSSVARKRVVLVTGTNRGLGKALAERIIQMGHTILGCGRDQESVDGMNRRFGGPHRFEVVDVANDNAVRLWIDGLDRAGLVPDLVVNNAALTSTPTQLWRLDHEEVEDVLRVNVLGTMNVLRHVIPKLLRRREGILVNFSSGWGREAAARVSPYCASKWAVEGLTKALAIELPPGIAVVAVHPGIVRSDTMARGFGEAAERYPTPDEWAKVAAPYLLGISAADNGQALSVPGMTAFHGIGSVLPERIAKLRAR